MTDTKEYLGIEIDYSKDSKLNKFSVDTLKDRYFWSDEQSPQEAFARASIFSATYKGHIDFNLAQRLYNYASDHWFMFSTPILSNGGTTRGLPISCFLNYVPDSRHGLSDHYDENIWLASSGGGIGGYWGDVRSDGISTGNGSRSTGSIPFMHVVDAEMLAFNQGTTRRGSYAAYSNISHPEIEEFINMRKASGGDINRKNLNLHNAVNITNEFLECVKDGKPWRLIDPKTNEPTKVIDARELWMRLLETRAETGEPYLINIDACNDALPQEQKDLGLNIKQSNLCSEITLATNEERTAVCCLSSVNLEYFENWKKNEEFIPDLVTMLDNVLEHFIEDIVDTDNLGGYTANLRGLKNMLKKIKKVWSKLLTQLTERGLSDWVQWVFTLTYKVKNYLLMGYNKLASTMLSLIELNRKQLKLLNYWLNKGGKLLIYMAATSVTLIFWLLLLMPVVLLYVVVLPLALNRIVLTSIRTKLYRATTKLKINS